MPWTLACGIDDSQTQQTTAERLIHEPSFARALVPRLSGGGLVVLVVILRSAFVAIRSDTGPELASELADSTVALKFVDNNSAIQRSSAPRSIRCTTG